jgi:hypothetical protein
MCGFCPPSSLVDSLELLLSWTSIEFLIKLQLQNWSWIFTSPSLICSKSTVHNCSLTAIFKMCLSVAKIWSTFSFRLSFSDMPIKPLLRKNKNFWVINRSFNDDVTTYVHSFQLETLCLKFLKEQGLGSLILISFFCLFECYMFYKRISIKDLNFNTSTFLFVFERQSQLSSFGR